MKENGKKMKKMVKGLKNGLVEMYMLVFIKMEWKMDKANINGKMEMNMKEIIIMIKLKELEYISGMMVKYIMVNG